MENSESVRLLSLTTSQGDWDKNCSGRIPGRVIEGGEIGGRDWNDFSFQSYLFSNVKFSKCKFNQVQLSQCRLTNCDFYDCIFEGFNLSGDLKECNFNSCIFDQCNMELANAHMVHITGGEFKGRLALSSETNCVFIQKCKITAIIQAGMRMRDGMSVQFSNCEIGASSIWGSFSTAVFSNVIFRSCSIKRAVFSDCLFGDCDLTGSDLGTSCDLSSCEMRGTRVTKIQLLSLAANLRPTVGAQSTMVIVYPLNDLKMQFGGWRRFVHSLVIISFMAPYFLIVLKSLLFLKYAPFSRSDVSIAGILWGYLKTGGTFHGIDFVYICTFFIMGFYNFCLRMPLLFKTLSLERREEISGVPVAFSLSDKYFLRYSFQDALKLTKVFMWIALLLAIYHICKVLSLPAPREALLR